MKLQFFSSTSKQGYVLWSQPEFLGYDMWVQNSDIELTSKRYLSLTQILLSREKENNNQQYQKTSAQKTAEIGLWPDQGQQLR